MSTRRVPKALFELRVERFCVYLTIIVYNQAFFLQNKNNNKSRCISHNYLRDKLIERRSNKMKKILTIFLVMSIVTLSIQKRCIYDSDCAAGQCCKNWNCVDCNHLRISAGPTEGSSSTAAEKQELIRNKRTNCGGVECFGICVCVGSICTCIGE